MRDTYFVPNTQWYTRTSISCGRSSETEKFDMGVYACASIVTAVQLYTDIGVILM